MGRFFYFWGFMVAAPLDILQAYWKYSEFRDKQEAIIHAVLEGNDTMALLPTGGGKSICYQVPGLAQEGLCLVISPLIALMKDQVADLQAKGIAATAVYSGLSYKEIDKLLDQCVAGQFKFLYVSPERLQTNLFQERLKQMTLNLLAVDEAHCISEWGYDFRPAYRNIADIRPLTPDTPVLALTATATETVRQDIFDQLNFENGQLFQKSFERSNLVYGVIQQEGKKSRLLETLQKVPGTSIVYARTRKDTKQISEYLRNHNISAAFYHGGLGSIERSRRQKAWKQGTIRVMVATNAFGMGIDKADVRSVLHLYLPDNLEAYYQEAGRAGRDGERAFALCILNKQDHQQLEDRKTHYFPSVKEIKQLYQALGNNFQVPIGSGQNQHFDFNLQEFASRYNWPNVKALNALKILEQQGFIATTDAIFLPSRLSFTVEYKDLYQFQVENPPYDPLIKTLLRSYEGIFDEYTVIQEEQVAKRSGIEEKELNKQLVTLQQYGIISYLPRKDQPQLFYRLPRMDIDQLNLDEAQLHRRKRLFEEKLDWVAYYAFKENHCHTNVLLNYFGEYPENACGHCDLCLKRKRAERHQGSFNELATAIQSILKNKTLTTAGLKEELKYYEETAILNALRWLYDEGVINVNNQLITLSKKLDSEQGNKEG